MKLTELIVPAYAQMLRALAGWLDKAEAQRPPAEADALLAARLAPDMFPLATQIRFACVQAREAVYRLTDAAMPDSLNVLLDEGRNGGDHPGTLTEARRRIDETLLILAAVAPDALDAREVEDIALALPMGLTFDMTGGQYARDWAQAQFYFHVVTAYAILRQQGVALGKADYVSYMFGYLRTGENAAPAPEA